MTDTALTTTEPQRQKPAPFQTGGAVGALVPQTLEEGFRLAQAMAMSGMTPRDIDTPEKVLVCIMAGAELGMKPFQAVQSFAIVNGRPSLWGDGLMALALTNGLDVEETIEGEGDDRTAYCTVTRPDNGKVVTRDYSVAKAKTAKLWGKVSANGKPSPWVTSPDRMLQMRARSYAIRDAAADVLRGMPIREEVEDFMESNPGIMDRQDEPKGTGLLAKLETAQVLGEAAVAGFGVRDVATEAGPAADAPEPKPKRPRKKAVDDALNAAGEELAAEQAASEAAMNSGDGPAIPASEDELAVFDAEEEAADNAENPENLPADAQVGETAAGHTDPASAGAYTQEMTEAFTADQHAIDGPAPADTIYFLAGEEPFASGRRAVWYNGKPNGSEDAAGDFPTYTQHTGEGSAPNLAENAADSEVGNPTTEQNQSDAANETLAEGGAELGRAATPFEAFDHAAQTATDWETLHGALVTLTRSDEWKADPEQKRAARLKTWAIVARFNEGGAKIDPVSDPFLLACFIEASTDVEVIEATLPLAREQPWFEQGGEAMQSGVARAVMDRVKALQGG